MVAYQTLIDPQVFFHQQTEHLPTLESKLRNFQRLFGRHNHALNEKPFFGILGDDLETLIWSGGGQDLAPLLCRQGGRQNPVTTFSDLFSRLGIEDALRQEIQQEMAKLADGAAMSFIKRLAATDGNVFSIVFKHRDNEPHGFMQFTLTDMSPFIAAEYAVRAMACHVIERMTETSAGGRSDLQRLHRIQTFAGKLLLLRNDADIEAQAAALVLKVETLASRTIDILQGFEGGQSGPTRQAETPNTLHDLSIALPGHTRSLGDWSTRAKRAEVLAGEQQHFNAREAHHMYFADSFIRNALPVMVNTTPDGVIYVLNGSKRGEVYDDVDVLVRDLGVEEISRRSASDFFTSRESGSTTLSINNENTEVRGLVTPDGGWQAMILPSMTDSIDVRGLFHAFKNLLLNLQVLHVVKTMDDVKTIGPALMGTLESIKERIENLRYLAKHGTTSQRRTLETVEMWVKAAGRVSGGHAGAIRTTGVENTGHLCFEVIPGEMEDCLSEIVRNAFSHGAENICIDLAIDHQRLMISISDDGNGISEQKLQQIRVVIETRRHDATLTTRSDGSGHGLLGVANVLSHFTGGRLDIDHNPAGRGTQVRLGINLPNQYR